MKLHSSCRRGREASLMLQGREDFSEVLCLMETALLPPGFFLPGGDFQTLPGCTGMPGALAKGSSTWKENAEHIQRWFVVLVLQSKVTHSLLRAVSVTSHTPGLLLAPPTKKIPLSLGTASLGILIFSCTSELGTKSGSRDVLLLKMTKTVNTEPGIAVCRHSCQTAEKTRPAEAWTGNSLLHPLRTQDLLQLSPAGFPTSSDGCKLNRTV